MSIHLSEVIAAVINLVIFYFFMKKFFFKKLEAVITERNNMIRKSLDQAEADKLEAAKTFEVAKIEAEKAKETGKGIIKAFKTKAETLYDEIVDEARQEGKLIVKRAEMDADRELENARKEMREEVVGLATILSKKVLGEEITEEVHERLVDEVIQKVGV